VVVRLGCLVCRMGLGLGGYVFAVLLKPVVGEMGWAARRLHGRDHARGVPGDPFEGATLAEAVQTPAFCVLAGVGRAPARMGRRGRSCRCSSRCTGSPWRRRTSCSYGALMLALLPGGFLGAVFPAWVQDRTGGICRPSRRSPRWTSRRSVRG
jgi:hypothetical protein